MKDMVLFLDVPNVGSRAKYYEAARSLKLLPVPVITSASDKKNFLELECLQVSSMDIGPILSAIDRIGRECIAGVFASGSAYTELAARLSAALGRPHADPDAISLCNDKRRLRDFLKSRGVNTVKYKHVTTFEDARTAAESLRGAVVVKPVSSTGSDGVRICRTADEAVLHARRLLKRKSDGILMEQYIDAPQYSVECFDGIPLIVKRTYFLAGSFPIMIGVDSPASINREASEDIKCYVQSILGQVGLIKGPGFVELRSSGEEKYLIEINTRPSTNSPVWLSAATGIDLAGLCLKFSCGIDYDRTSLTPKFEKACAQRYLIRNGASVRTIEGSDKARTSPNVVMFEQTDSNFTRRGIPTSVYDRIATVQTAADTIDVAAASAETAIRKLTVVYDKFPMEKIKYYRRRIRQLSTQLSKKAT